MLQACDLFVCVHMRGPTCSWPSHKTFEELGPVSYIPTLPLIFAPPQHHLILVERLNSWLWKLCDLENLILTSLSLSFLLWKMG